MSEKDFKVPEFETIEEEAEFWDEVDTAEVWDQLEEVEDVVFTKPDRQVVSFRMDRDLVDKMKSYAQKLDTPYTALIRMWAVKGFKREIEREVTETPIDEEAREKTHQ